MKERPRRARKGETRAQIEALGELHGKDTSAITGDMDGGYTYKAPKKRDDREAIDQIAVISQCRAKGYPWDRIRSYPAEGSYMAGGGHGLATKLRAMGLMAGVPDLFLPVQRGGYAGLYIELKAAEMRSGGKIVKRAGVLSDAQKDEIGLLRRDGYAVAICYGDGQAMLTISKYLALGGKRNE